MITRAVVFDMDGVLIDSEEIWHQVRRDFVASFGGAWTAQHQRDCMGANSAQWSRYIRHAFAAPMTEREIFDGVVAMLRDRYEADLPVIPGARDAVLSLAEVGLSLAVASSSPLILIEFLVERLGLADCFQALVSSDAVERGKPAPDVYMHACGQLGTQPGHAAAVEDSGNGILAAAEAGLYVIAIPSEAFPPDAAALQRASRVLGSIEELTPTILP